MKNTQTFPFPFIPSILPFFPSHFRPLPSLLILSLSLTFTTFFTNGNAETNSTSYTPIKDKNNVKVLTPAIAKQKTEKIRLPNGLEAYLISDPDADVSGAMLSVKVGSWDDPKDHPGLAHFLEHMLFMGTKSFPDESEYERFIYEHGGEMNAFTTSSSTNYLFTIHNSAFTQALHRFSSFFKEPLFNPSGVARELRAIDQEYAKNLENDNIRQLYVLKEIIDPNHPFHQFNMGNSESLSNISQEELKQWYQEHYSANLMRLVIYSSLPMETIKKNVVSLFKDIPNTGKSPFTVTTPAYTKEHAGKFIYLEPTLDSRKLTLIWELPPKFSHVLEKQPGKIVCHVLGHEGEKSLLAQLKKEKLAESVACGETKLGDDLFLSYIEIELTDEGLHDVDQVINRTFQAINNFKQKEIPPYLFDEIKQMATIEHQYQSKKNEFRMLMNHAFQIQDEEISTYPRNTAIPQVFDSELVNELLTHLTPHNARFFIMAPSKLTKVKNNKKEKWLGVPYTTRDIPKEQLAKWRSVSTNDQIDLPRKNVFIPDDLAVQSDPKEPITKQLPYPKTLMNNENGQIYYAKDTKFHSPRIHWTFNVRTPEIIVDNSTKVVLGDLYVKLLEDHLNKISYPAKIAGLEYEITREDNGIKIVLKGYSQNADLLFHEILKATKEFDPSQEKFRIYKDSLLREYQNTAKESPVKQSIELLKSVIYKQFVTDKDKAVAIRKVSFPRFKEFTGKVFNKTYLEGVIYGNIDRQMADKVVSDLSQTFNQGRYPKDELFQPRVIVLPKDEGPHFLEFHTKAQGNAVLLAVENSNFSFKERAVQQVIMQAIKEPFFSALRTKQQTGYLVHSLPEEIERKLFNLFIVQSNTHDPRDLLARFEAFIETYLMELGKTELTEEQYKNIKKSLVKQLEEPAKNVDEMGELLFTLGFKYDGDFLWLSKRMQALRDLKYEEAIDGARAFLGRQNKQRLAILLTGELPKENVFSYTRARTWNMLRKVSEFEGRVADQVD